MPFTNFADSTVGTYDEPQSEAMQHAIYGVQNQLIAMLEECTPAQREVFKRMYPGEVGDIPIAKLDWACFQVENTLRKKD